MTKERDQLLSEVVKLRESLAQTTEKHQEMERVKEDAEQTIVQVGAAGRRMKECHPFEDVLSFLTPFLSVLLSKVPSCAHVRHPLLCLSPWFVLWRAVVLELFFLQVLSENSPRHRLSAYSRRSPRGPP